MLGLTHKGHLGVGADADVTIYTPAPIARPCSSCRDMLSRAARSSSNRARFARDLYGKTLHVAPEFDAGVLPDVKKWFESFYTIQFANYPVDESYMAHGAVQ